MEGDAIDWRLWKMGSPLADGWCHTYKDEINEAVDDKQAIHSIGRAQKGDLHAVKTPKSSRATGKLWKSRRSGCGLTSKGVTSAVNTNANCTRTQRRQAAKGVLPVTQCSPL